MGSKKSDLLKDYLLIKAWNNTFHGYYYDKKDCWLDIVKQFSF